jgi:5-methyltetrahydropteroyltriglutamate--homocysteine methyltransferase
MSRYVETSVIGSYPVNIDPWYLMEGYYQGVQPSWEQYIEHAVCSMTAAGIDIISDGQTRDPFIHIFARGLNGCRVRKRPEVIEPIDLDQSITGEDLRFVKSILPKGRKLMGLIVGPYTLSESLVDLYYHDSKELAFACAEALRKEITCITPLVDMISIDEPFFSNHLPEYGMELVSILTEQVSVPIRLHVCGDVSSIVDQLVDYPVDMLSHEFKASPQLFEVFKQYPSNKGVCLGAVRSDIGEVEPIDEIVDHIRIGSDVFGSHLRQIAPDCGLRLLPEQCAYEKLQNLVAAKRIVYG